MLYRNFEIRIAHLVEDRFSAVVTDSPHGRGGGEFVLPCGLDDYRIPQAGTEARLKRELAPDDSFFEKLGGEFVPGGGSAPVATPSPEEAGRLLFGVVFAGKVGELFRKSHDPRYGLRIILVFQDAAAGEQARRLHALPWELMVCDRHLAVNPCYSIVRQLDGGVAPEHALVPAGQELRVLIAGANPNDTDALALERERQLMQRLDGTAGVSFKVLEKVNRRGLHERLEEGFDVIHFMGHGDWVEGQPALFLLDEHGDAAPVTGRELVEELLGLTTAQWPRLFVLNACHGGAVALGPSGLTGVAAELFRAGLPAVVAMRQEIGDEAAVTFSRTFYRAVAQRLSLDEAMGKARLAIKREHDLALDWATPCLFSKSEDGLLFPAPEPGAAGGAQSVTGRPRRRGFRWLWAIAAVSAIGLLLGILASRSGEEKLRVAIEPLDREVTQVRWEILSTRWGLAGVEGLVVVEDKSDFRVRLGIDRNSVPPELSALVINQANDARTEIRLTMPVEGGDSEMADLQAALLGRILKVLGREGAAIAAVSNYQAIARAAEGDYQGAEKLLGEAIEQNPDLAAPHANLAMILLHQDRFEDALKPAGKAAQLAPDLPLVHYNLGMILLEIKRFDESTAALASALKLDPNYRDAHYALAKIKLAREQWDGARRELEKTLRIDPDHVPALVALGRLDLDRGDPDRAIPNLVHALELAPDGDVPRHAEILFLQAKSLFQMGNREQSQEKLLRYQGLPDVGIFPWTDDYAKLREGLGMPFAPAPPLGKGYRGDVGDSRKSTELVRDRAWDGAYLVAGARPGGDERLAILGPLGATASTRPELIWTDVAAAEKYELNIEAENYGTSQFVLNREDLGYGRFSIGSESIRLCHLVWPDRALQPGQVFELRIVPLFAVNQPGTFDEMRAEIRVLDAQSAEELEKVIDAIKGLDLNPDSRLARLAGAYGRAGVWGESLNARSALLINRGWPEDEVALANGFLFAGLDPFARRVIEHILSVPVAPAIQAACETMLGYLQSRASESSSALVHLGRARALYVDAGLLCEVFLVEQAMDRIRATNPIRTE